ncbi:MAG TPA: STAS domain-containing protein [Jatrophihabitantaceae bacterium]|nr:STAS domain-containing protein [Jatrophihabitantaceae bacterium]
MTGFTVSVQHHAASTDVLIGGDVGLEVADQLKSAGIDAVRTSDRPRVVIDLGDVTFLDSSGLGALVTIRTEAIDAGKDVRLRNVPPRVARVLAITGLTDAFPVDDSPAA